MKLIKVLKPFKLEQFEIVAPELIVEVKIVSVAPETVPSGVGTVITIHSNIYGSMDGYLTKKIIRKERKISCLLCAERIDVKKKVHRKGKLERSKKEKIDNPDFEKYFAAKVIAIAKGDIVSRAIDYIREVILVEQGLKTKDTKIIEI